MASLKEGPTDTSEQEILSEEIKGSSSSNGPVWETFPLPTITNVFSQIDEDNPTGLAIARKSAQRAVIRTLNDGTVPKRVRYHKQMPPEETKKRLTAAIWNNCPPVVEFDPNSTLVKTCKSVHLNNLPFSFTAVYVKELIYLKTDFDPFSEQSMHVFMYRKPNVKRSEAVLLFSNNQDCVKVFIELQGLVILNTEVTVKLDLGGKISKRYKCTKYYPDQNETKGGTLPELSSPTKDMPSCNVGPGNSSQNDTFKKTSEVKNSNSNNKDSTDKLATNEIIITQPADETVPIKQEPADEDDISEATEEEPRVTDLEIGEAMERDDFDAMIQKQEMDTGDMIQTTNDAESNAYSNQEDDTECTVVHVKGLPVKQAYTALIQLIKSCETFDSSEKTIYLRLLKVQGVLENVNGEALLKFSTNDEAVGVCDYLNTKIGLEAKLDVGNVISDNEDLIPIFNKEENRCVMAKYAEQWQYLYTCTYLKISFLPKKNSHTKNPIYFVTENTVSLYMDLNNQIALILRIVDLRSRSKRLSERVLNKRETYGLSFELLKSLNIRFPLTNTVSVANLSPKVTDAKLIEVFSMAGEVKKISHAPTLTTDGNKIARIKFDHPIESVQAISMFHGQKLYNTKMTVHMFPFIKMGLPVGLEGCGRGLGENGIPLRDVRTNYLMRRLEPRNGPYCTGNTKPYNKTFGMHNQSNPHTQPIRPRHANIDVKPKWGTASLQKHKQAGPRPTKVNTGSIFGAYSSKSKNMFSSNTQKATANPANIFSNPQQNIFSNTRNNPVNPVETNRAQNAPIFGSQPTNVFPSVGSGISNPTISSYPNVQYPLQNTQNSGPNAVYAVSNYMTYITPNSNYPPTNMLPPNYVPTAAYIPNPTPIMTMNYQGARSDGTPNCGQVATNTASMYSSLHVPSSSVVPAAPAPPSISETPKVVQKVTNSGQKQANLSAASKRLKNILLSAKLTSKQSKEPRKSPQPGQSKYKTESYKKEKKEETSRKRDYEGKTKKETAGGTDDSKKMKPVLYFRNLPDSVNTEALTMKMQEVGDIMFSQVTEKGRAIVCFKTIEDCERCLRLFNHSKVDGRIIDVTYHLKK